jgi:hypothetical protein
MLNPSHLSPENKGKGKNENSGTKLPEHPQTGTFIWPELNEANTNT